MKWKFVGSMVAIASLFVSQMAIAQESFLQSISGWNFRLSTRCTEVDEIGILSRMEYLYEHDSPFIFGDSFSVDVIGSFYSEFYPDFIDSQQLITDGLTITYVSDPTSGLVNQVVVADNSSACSLLFN